MPRGSQDSHTGKAHTLWEDGAGTVGQGKDGSHDLQQVLCLLETQSPYLSVEIRKSIISIPILQVRKQRLDQGPLAVEPTGRATALWLCQSRLRCESLLQTLLSVSRVVATKGTPREGGSLHKSSLQRVPGNTPVLLYKNLIS